MNMTAYIKAQNNFPEMEHGVYALYGFRQLGTNIKFYEDIEEVPLNRYSMVVGDIADVRKFMEGMGWKQPESLNIPECLRSYAKRDFGVNTIEQFKESPFFPVFIKPYEQKRFIAGVIENQKKFDFYFGDIPSHEKIMWSDVLDIKSEYRGYVINHELVDLKHYLGDLDFYPDVSEIRTAIRKYKSNGAFAAYSIDFGVTNEGSTVLIECNDFTSLGNYGLRPKAYAKGIMVRWRELLELNPVEMVR